MSVAQKYRFLDCAKVPVYSFLESFGYTNTIHVMNQHFYCDILCGHKERNQVSIILSWWVCRPSEYRNFAINIHSSQGFSNKTL